MPQGSIYWQGTQRRSCAPGAHWNVQVVRGKVTTRCLWHACKALGIGLLLMLLGACMATIGYYADQLSTGQEIRGNVTVKVKNKSKGFHLNNLSYAGPIVMGVGGFIVVAACVMTFEARDSAAKVVPARFRFSQGSTLKYARNQRPRRSTSSQTSKWDHQLGLFRINKTPSPNAYEISRKQLTAEFLRFSKNLNEKNNPQINTIKKSPSAPSLVTKKSPLKKKQTTKYSGCSLLNPELLKRHALSVDNPGYSPTKSKDNNDNNNKINGSQMSMAMDLYLPNKGPVTLKIKDRSDTARRHQLLRQTKIEDMEEEEAKRQASIRRHAESVAYMMGAYARYPTDFVSRKRASIDLRLTDEYGAIGVLSKGNSPRDLRKTSPNFRQMSVDRSSSLRKSSIDFRKSPDFRRSDNKYMMDEVEIRSRSNTGESNRKARHKLHHSKSDESRRKSLDRHNRRDSHQESRHSLNTPVVIETCGPEYELKYFTPNSIDKDNASNTTEDSHVIEIEETEIHITTASIEDYPNDNALVEEPELETINDNEIDEKLSHKIINDEKNKNKYIDEYNSNEPTINVDD